MLLLFYIIVVSSISPDCQSEWDKIYASQENPDIPERYSLMYRYSGFSYNSLGNFESCKKINEAKYVVEIYQYAPLVVVTLCGPKICNETDYYDSSIPMLPSLLPSSFAVIFPEEYQEAHYGTFSFEAILMLIFIGVVTTLSLYATFIDLFLSNEDQNYISVRILLCFSVLANGKKLVAERAGKEDTLALLDGARVMSMGWIIFGHILANCTGYAATGNFDTHYHKTSETIVILGTGAEYAVDSFLWISGVLMAYLFIIELNKLQKFTGNKIFLMYIHRFLRITPMYLFCVLFIWSMQRYIGSGPLWIDAENLVGNCDEYWYANFIYLNNFIPGFDNICIDTTWYLSIDMQFFLISPLVILVYVKYSKELGWLIICSLCLINVIAAGIIAYHYDLNPAPLSGGSKIEYFNYYYIKPYTRIAPYALGLGCGIIVYTYRKYQEICEVYDKYAFFVIAIQKKWYFRVAGFILGLSVINLLVFSPESSNKETGPDNNATYWSDTQNYIYIAFERFSFGLGLSLVLLPLLLGYFKPITKLLSLYYWTVLSRFTFAIYLIHDSIIKTTVKSQKNELFFDDYYSISETIIAFIVSLFFAVPIVLLIEIPCANIEKIIFSREILGEKNKRNE